MEVKLFIAKEVVSDDDGNLYCEVTIFTKEQELVDYIIARHKDVYETFVNSGAEIEDDWDEDSPLDGFEIYDAFDCVVCTRLTKEEKTITI